MKSTARSILLCGAALGLAGCLTAAPNAAAKAQVDAFLNAEMAKWGLDRMSCAFSQHGETRYAYLNRKDIPETKGFNAETPLPTASMTKVLTSIMIIQLVEEGKVCLHDPVKLYVPLFPSDTATVAHLMTHTTGIRNRGGHVPKGHKDYAKFYETMYKQDEPGVKFNYMSQGYDILAEIIEDRTGVADVKDVAQARVFGPVGMTHTTFSSHQGQVGMSTTAEDILKLGNHLLTILKTRKAGILSPEGADAVFRPILDPKFHRTPAFFVNSYDVGFGQYFSVLNSPRAVGHAGATGCYFMIDPEYEIVAAIFTNSKKNNFSPIDGNFSRVNAMMQASFGDNPAPLR